MPNSCGGEVCHGAEGGLQHRPHQTVPEGIFSFISEALQKYHEVMCMFVKCTLLSDYFVTVLILKVERPVCEQKPQQKCRSVPQEKCQQVD